MFIKSNYQFKPRLQSLHMRDIFSGGGGRMIHGRET
jgi:hypothetical protein